MANYGTVNGGNAYFDARLHAWDWDQASVEDRGKALTEATELIDMFDYVGCKYAVQVVVDALGDDADLSTDENQEAMRLANLSQELEFPRGSVDTVPTEIENACYLIAKALLGGRDPEADLESLATKSTRYGDVQTAYDRSGNTMDHLAHLIPSPQAYNLLRPFMRERNTFDMYRV